MARKFWKERYSKGICNFEINYDFFYKWLVSKTASCFYIDGLTETLDDFYIKSNLLIDGDVCITDFNGDLYAVCGAPGGEPSAYYKPTLYTAANPVLGSKIVRDGIDGVIIYNTPIDAYLQGGINGLIVQTATLLADNIVSVNCCQINSRVTAINTADSEAQALAAESVMKSIYAGNPYKIVRSDIIDKIRVNPIAQTGAGNLLSELIELHNYIISNYFQAIGIRANNQRKKAHMLQDEIDLQNSYLQISVYEILTSWQKGFDKVNEMYGTDIHVRLNPALLPEIVGDQNTDNTDIDTAQYADPDVNSYIDVSAGAQTDTEQTDTDPTDTDADTNDNQATDSADTDTADTAEQDDNTDTLAENAVDLIEQREEIVDDIIDMINAEGGDENVDDSETIDAGTGDSME